MPVKSGGPISAWIGERDPVDGRGSTEIAQWYGERLRRELRARHWTMRYCALQAGVDHSTISRLVRGTRVPSLDTARRLDEALRGPSLSLGPAVRLSATNLDPIKRVADALSHDPVLDRHTREQVLRYYAHVRSRPERPTPG